jgi:hypothetical protein
MEVLRYFSLELFIHCKDAVRKIRNKYSQKKELSGYSPNSYIHVSVSDLYVYSPDRLPILPQENRWTPNVGIYRSFTDT